MMEKKGPNKGRIAGQEKAINPQGNHKEISTETRPDVIARAILENLYHVQGRVPQIATLQCPLWLDFDNTAPEGREHI